LLQIVADRLRFDKRSPANKNNRPKPRGLGLLSEKGPQQTFNYRLARGLLSSDSFGNLHSY
jgi:hypothetical protein